MMDTDLHSPDPLATDLFRPAKRRRFYRKRTDADNDDDTSDCPTQSPSAAPPELQTVDELISNAGDISRNEDQGQEDISALSVPELVRRRKAIQRRKGGIEFTNPTPSLSTSNGLDPGEDLGIEEDEVPANIKSVIERFAPQTGQVTASTDKHMMAYIDSELAKRTHENHTTSIYSHNGHELSPNGALLDATVQRQPAALGKLHEIDLGPDATLRNIARTEAAQRKLEGIEPEVDESTGSVRLRRDGKPYGWRRRRNSNDIKRDKLVEDVMRESKLEIYDEPDNQEPNDDQAADDRIAEQFRREFMDAISNRRQKTAQDRKQAKGQPANDQPKGPKLGGSRSARAAMREKEEAATKKR